MNVFRRLVSVALCAGLLSGIVVAAAHQIETVPVILKAEVFEKAAEHAQPAHVHPGATAGEQATVWEPENGIERTAYTLLADLLTGIGLPCCSRPGSHCRAVQSRGARALMGSGGVCDFHSDAGSGSAAGTAGN